MKVTAIIGTGVKTGNVSKICNGILNGANKNGHETDLVFLSEQKILPCIGCYKCLGEAPCIFQDDFHKIYQKCVTSDVIILGTPVYFGNVSGLLKNFIDRFNGNAFFNSPLMARLPKFPKKDRLKTYLSKISKEYRPSECIQGKRVIRVITANKPYLFLKLRGEFRTTNDALSHFIKGLKWKNAGSILYSGTIFNPEGESKILKRCFDMGYDL